ncbi:MULTISPECIES: S8 family peptidase [unclassified Streptomyces]|uniref:S8 family peptidase n=1 Tax=unclassified Streptomyces TaxID=2593676 RepID=UPI000DB9C4ED|nr:MULTISPECIES: S8 family peptidase [unclassified Streptomyces]MYT68761.1 S8 family serine peptidase [Streptomyces sp. SID8367]RAJ86434.1 subtilase family protein [Streptomyces sp. PsTaAH-137]
MHRQPHSRTRRAALVAGAAAVAVTAGVALPAHSAPAAAAHRTGAGQQFKPKTHITLITGDRVAVDAKGRPAGVEPAAGRAHIPVQTRTVAGHTYVVPLDAQRLIAAGKLDQRLFDITELSKASYKKAQKSGLKVIVGYKGAAAGARAEVRDAGDTTVRRSLKALNADAVTTPKSDAVKLWDAVTDQDGSTASGVSRVWLDGIRRASLDKSVPQIGAPTAWAAGYDGKGVKIAVLDTGVDATHPDLKSQVVESKNFSAAPDATDHFGHGTHVASIAAGTGAKSGGKYKGVAPGAKLLNGKVLDNDGFGDDSGILAGMEWAAAQGADIVNLSLGGGDTAEIDPLEAEVNKLSQEKGILFAIAAGNEGPNSIGSPGSADAALTVGAVDDKDKLADFSSTGPRVGDAGIKPDVTAPGVDITAAAAPGSVIAQEVGEKPAGYLTISGTSMATPHVAGAAAILKQQHPDWTYTQLKGALVGSAKGTAGLTPFQQGSGRIQVDRAIEQTVFAESVSVGFGVAQWPHTDDKPATKPVTYRNTGTKDVTLDLTVQGTGPKGQPAPAGFFTLGSTKVTVPAGGTASVDVTADTRLGGTADGAYSAYITATGDGQTVRTAAAVQREIESYDVKLTHLGRDGKPLSTYLSDLIGYTGLGKDQVFSAEPSDSGTVTLRVPKGDYLLDAWLAKDVVDFKGGVDWFVQPKLAVTKNITLTLDARKTKKADITVPDTAAKPVSASIAYAYDPAEIGLVLQLGSFADVRMAGLGPDVSSGLSQTWFGQWRKGSSAEYDVATAAKVKHIVGDKSKHFKKSELATVANTLGSSVAGKTGALTPVGVLADDLVFGAPVEQKLPGTRTLYLSAGERVQWTYDFLQFAGKDADGNPVPDASYSLGTPQTFKAGSKYAKTFNTAVFAPRVGGDYGLFRDGNDIAGYVPLFADGKTHAGSSDVTSVATTLYRNGTKIGSNKDPLYGEPFTVPSGDAAYKLTTSVKRSTKVSAVSTRVDATWTFRSKKTADFVTLPAAGVRFTPAVGSDSRATAGKTQSVPVTVTGAAAGSKLKSLSVYVSYDDGKNFKKVTVKSGKVSVKNPAKGKGITLRAKITDKKGNTSTITIYKAYLGK